MQTSEKTDLIDAALAAAQAEIEPALKDSVNPHFRSNYADLASVHKVARQPLSKHGISLSHIPLTDFDRKAVGCSVRLGHKSGQWLIYDPLWAQPARGLAPQDVGATMTYLRRYTTCAVLNISTDDDDAETAEGRGSQSSKTVSKGPHKEHTARLKKVVDAFRSIGWTDGDIEDAVGCRLDDFTDKQFDFAYELFKTEKARNSQNAMRKFEDAVV